MINPLSDVIDFIETGGDVLFVILFLSVVFWALSIEKYLFYTYVFKPKSKALKKFWKEREDKDSWESQQVKQAQVSTLITPLNKNIFTLKAIIMLFPLMGLLGTVTGMISVFDSMSSFGANARAMAGGISMATLPTMAGMFLAVLGIFVFTRLDFLTKSSVRKLKDKLLKDSDA